MLNRVLLVGRFDPANVRVRDSAHYTMFIECDGDKEDHPFCGDVIIWKGLGEIVAEREAGPVAVHAHLESIEDIDTDTYENLIVADRVSFVNAVEPEENCA